MPRGSLVVSFCQTKHWIVREVGGCSRASRERALIALQDLLNDVLGKCLWGISTQVVLVDVQAVKQRKSARVCWLSVLWAVCGQHRCQCAWNGTLLSTLVSHAMCDLVVFELVP